MRRLKASNAETDRVVRLVKHQSDLFPPDAPGAGVRRWLRDLGPELVNDLFRLRFALWRARHAPGSALYGDRAPGDLLERWRSAHVVRLTHPPLEVKDLAIGGADLIALGVARGPRIGELLRALLERVLDRPELNTRSALLELVTEELSLS